jgi:solute carrier family 1 (high affinity glutamate transporter) protein 3
VPENLVGDAANARFLQVIVASLILGLLIKERDEEGRPSATLKVVGELNEVVVRTIKMLMGFTPVGVGCLVFSSAATMDFASTGSLIGKFVLSVCVGYAVHLFVVYPSLVLLLARRNPVRYMCNVVPAILTALGTSSSAATLPVTTRCCVEGNGIRPHTAKFVLSLGATINMDGTGLWLICSVYFLGVIEGVEFTVGKFMLMSVLAMLCSLGSAPVPNAGLVLLVTMLGSVGVPQTSSFALVVAIDWLLDRGQTVVNVTGDCAVTAVIDRMLGDRCSIEQDADDVVTEDGEADSCSCLSEQVV